MKNQNDNLCKKITQIFSIPIVSYDNKNYKSMNSDIISKLEFETYKEYHTHPNQTLENHLEKRDEYKDLYNWFDDCLEDYRKLFQYDCEQFKIILSWANVSNDKNSHGMHTHPNSFISGIYYLSENSSPTYFQDIKDVNSGWRVSSRNAILNDIWKSPSKTGSLLLFPSWMPHCTKSKPFEGLRYTISFNVIPVGANKGGLTEFEIY